MPTKRSSTLPQLPNITLSLAVRRVLAFGVDWLLIGAWGTVVFGAVMMTFDGQPPRPTGPWQLQGLGALFMTIPVVLYFAVSESTAQATLGKLALGLVVVSEQSTKPKIAHTLLRNAVKFAPWELGHVVANQSAFAGEAGFPVWGYVPLALATLLPIWWLVRIFTTDVSPYDALSATRVVRTTSVPAT